MKKLIDLTMEEVKNLFACNSWLQDQAKDRAAEEADFFGEEVLSYFHNVRGIRYEIAGSWNRNYFDVNYCYYSDFLDALRNAQNEICILSDEEEKVLSRLEKKIDFFRDCSSGYEDISEKRYNHLEKFIDNSITFLCDCIVKYISSSYDFYNSDEGAAESLEILIDNIGADYETDGRYIYEIDVRKYA